MLSITLRYRSYYRKTELLPQSNGSSVLHNDSIKLNGSKTVPPHFQKRVFTKLPANASSLFTTKNHVCSIGNV